MRFPAVLVLVVAALVPAVRAQAADVPTCRGLPATIVGTDGPDVIRGTAADDVIVAGAGNDVVRPGPGDDVVCGGGGHDYLVSHRGADVLLGGADGDRIEAFSAGPSVVRGGRGDDFLFLAITDEPGYVLVGGPGDDIADLRKHPRAEDLSRVTVDRRNARFLRGDGVTTVTGVFAAEQVGLDELLPYTYLGSPRDDSVSVADGAFPFVARTFRGDDTVLAAEGDDDIDTGAGRDTVDAGPGEDVCRHAERARGCETS